MIATQFYYFDYYYLEARSVEHPPKFSLTSSPTFKNHDKLSTWPFPFREKTELICNILVII